MGDCDHDFTDPFFLCNLCSLAGDFDDGRSGNFVHDFDVGPLDAFGPTGTEDFQDGFFGCPSTGVMLRCGFAGGAVENFLLRENTLQEDFAMLFDHLGNSHALNDICADANQIPRHVVLHFDFEILVEDNGPLRPKLYLRTAWNITAR